jgi:hypothetical protein
VLSEVSTAAAMPAPDDAESAPIAFDHADADRTRLAQAQPAPSPPPSPQAPTPGTPSPAPAAAPSDEPIGNVATITGTATVIRSKNSIALKLKDDIFLNDTVQTSAGASLSITFNDATTFRLSANAKITIDNYVYEESGSKNAGLFDIGKGTVAFVAASVAKTGNMQINTPTATLGIRGTTGLVEVPEGATATGANNVNIKLYPDADGRVGRIEVNDRQGARLGALTQGASGFSIRPGTAGARFAAVPLVISPQVAARDQGFVRQVHAAQTAGRQIVTEQRAIRRANPPGQQPPRQPGQQPQQRQPGQPQQPGQNRPGQRQPGAPRGQDQQKQQPGTPNRPGTPNPAGQPQRQGAPTQQGAPNRQGQQQPREPQQPAPQQQGQPQSPGRSAGQGQPGATPQPALQPRPGGLQQGGPGRPRPQLQKPAPAKDKRKKH